MAETLATTDSSLGFGRLDGLLGFHLRMASAAVARDFAAAMDELGLTQKQCAVLELIDAGSGSIGVIASIGLIGSGAYLVSTGSCERREDDGQRHRRPDLEGHPEIGASGCATRPR